MRLFHRLTFALLGGLPMIVCLTACENSADVAPPGAISEGEAAALDEAAKMLDQQRLPQGALPDVDPPVTKNGRADTAEPQQDLNR